MHLNHRIPGEAVDILLATYSALQDISIFDGFCHQLFNVGLRDPEDEAPVRCGRVNDGTVRDTGRNEDDVGRRHGIALSADLHFDVPFHRKIEFIVIMRMDIDRMKVGVAVVIQLVVL